MTNIAYQTSLHHHKKIMDLLIHERGLSKKTILDFGIGFSGKYALASIEQKYKNELQEMGVLNLKGNDRNWRRITFPIRNQEGEIAGFIGRQTSEGDVKYLLPMNNKYLLKSQSLFNLYQASPYIKKEKFVYIVEGVFDVMALWQAGIKNVVAPLGTELTQNQLKLISNYTNSFILAFDGDVAGFKASLKVTKLIRECMRERKPEWTINEGLAFLTLSKDRDIGDYLKKPSELRKLVYHKHNFASYFRNKMIQGLKYKEVFLDFKKQSYESEVMKVEKSHLTWAIEQHVDIVQVASRYADIKKSGHNYIVACTSPKHADLTPSMVINPTTQRFRCFGCGCHGNVIQLVADAEMIKYTEARTKLKNEYGIKGFDHIKNESNPFHSVAKEVVLDYVINVFNYTLTSNAPDAIKYMEFLNKHGIDQEQISKYKIGLASPDDKVLVKALVVNGYNLDVACKVGVLRKVGDTYESNITSSITMATCHGSKLIGIDVFKADEIGKLKMHIQHMKANQMMISEERLIQRS